MADDIVTLREDASKLLDSNVEMRRHLADYDDLSRAVIDSQLVDGLPQSELCERYIVAQQQLHTKDQQILHYEQQLTEHRRELADKQGDAEEDKMLAARQSQQGLLTQLGIQLRDYDKLGASIKHNQSVIEGMESMMTAHFSTLSSADRLTGVAKDAYEATLSENKKLRAQLDEFFKLESGASDGQSVEDLEAKIQMQRHEVAELEREVRERSREVGKSKQDMLLETNQLERGLAAPEHVFAPPYQEGPLVPYNFAEVQQPGKQSSYQPQSERRHMSPRNRFESATSSRRLSRGMRDMDDDRMSHVSEDSRASSLQKGGSRLKRLERAPRLDSQLLGSTRNLPPLLPDVKGTRELLRDMEML